MDITTAKNISLRVMEEADEAYDAAAAGAQPSTLPGFPMMPMVPGMGAMNLQESAASLLTTAPPVAPRHPRPFSVFAPRQKPPFIPFAGRPAMPFSPMRPHAPFIPQLPPPPQPQFPTDVPPDTAKHEGTSIVPAKASGPGPSPEDRRARSRSRSRSRRRGGRRSRRRRRSRSRSEYDDPNDHRPDIEKRKGGVKLFLGRLPQEVSEREIRDCFEDYGRVIEVFKMKGESPGEKRHSPYHEDGFTCAFVRVASLKMAEECIEELHEQRCLIADKRHLGAMQVAFAKGEAARLGLPEIREMLPDRLEAKERVRLQREKGLLLGAASQILGSGGINVMLMRETILQSIVQDGLGRDDKFKSAWTHYCQSSWGGTTETDPSLHGHNSLAQFVAMRTFDYMNVPWFKERIDDASSKCMLGELPPSMPPSMMPVPTPPRPVLPPVQQEMWDTQEAEFDQRPQEVYEVPLPEVEEPQGPPQIVQEVVNYDDI